MADAAADPATSLDIDDSSGGRNDIACHGDDLTARNEFHNGKAQKKAG
jgi:hypothetical protein